MSINSQSWFTLEQVCELLHITPKTVKNRCYKGDFIYKIQLKNNVKQFFIHSSSIKLKKISEINDKKYSDAPKWSKIQAEKYIKIVKKCLNIKGKELQEFISNWNNDNPDLATSYSSVIRMRSRYIQCGISGLLAKYGNNCGKCIIDDNDFEYFKNLYLKEGAPSLQSRRALFCFLSARGGLFCSLFFQRLHFFGAARDVFPDFFLHIYLLKSPILRRRQNKFALATYAEE